MMKRRVLFELISIIPFAHIVLFVTYFFRVHQKYCHVPQFEYPEVAGVDMPLHFIFVKYSLLASVPMVILWLSMFCRIRNEIRIEKQIFYLLIFWGSLILITYIYHNKGLGLNVWLWN